MRDESSIWIDERLKTHNRLATTETACTGYSYLQGMLTQP
jgi:hypothetical protein